jgi:hypothetical protein
MSRSRSLRYLLEAFSLVAVFAITLTAAAYACFRLAGAHSASCCLGPGNMWIPKLGRYSKNVIPALILLRLGRVIHPLRIASAGRK